MLFLLQWDSVLLCWCKKFKIIILLLLNIINVAEYIYFHKLLMNILVVLTNLVLVEFSSLTSDSSPKNFIVFWGHHTVLKSMLYTETVFGFYVAILLSNPSTFKYTMCKNMFPDISMLPQLIILRWSPEYPRKKILAYLDSWGTRCWPIFKWLL